MRVGTRREHYGPDCHPDRDAVELGGAVKRALSARQLIGSPLVKPRLALRVRPPLSPRAVFA